MTRARAAARQTPVERVSLNDLINAKRSMLSADHLPVNYGHIETVQDALEAATVPPPTVVLRMTIVWDNDAATLDLEGVLAEMRATGAAMVVSVEQVSE